jgi:exosortase
MCASDTFRNSWGRLPGWGKADAIALVMFALGVTGLLWPAWIHNPDLTHGLLMPLVFVLLLRESRTAGPDRYLRPGILPGVAVAALAGAGLAALATAVLYSAAVGGSNALVEFLAAASLTFLLGAGLIALADERIRLVPCNWSSVAAVGLWLLTAPIPPGTASRLTLALQLWVSSGVMDALQLLHVAAHRQGNIIELATGSVGVAEACSGVRSLVSCVFVGLFFSATLVRRPVGRAVLVGAAAPLALAMNFARSLGLTLLVNAGFAIAGFWHDATGFAVLGLTAVLLAGLALGLGSGEEPRAAVPPRPPVASPRTVVLRILAASLVLVAALGAFSWEKVRPAEHPAGRGPDLLSLLPPAPPGWTAQTVGDLARYSGILQTEALAQRVYASGQDENQIRITIYVAYWRAGQASVAAVAAHTPDACWPGAGWEARATPHATEGLSVGGRQLAPAESRLFSYGDYPQHVWFWHLVDGRPIPYRNPYSLRSLAGIAWHYGFTRGGDQLFVSIASNRPWDSLSNDAVLSQFFAQTRRLGL